MRAVVYERYGSPDVLYFKDLPKPVPKDHEILIRICATTVTTGDWRARSLQMPAGFGLMGRLFFGVSKPRQPILGTELAGVVELIGRNVSRFKIGDEVFAFTGGRMGCHAEYTCLPEDGAVALKPPRLNYGEAAALSFGGTTMLDFFKRGKLQRGDRVFVNGASGAVGTAAVQLARHFGAVVTGVCSSSNIGLVRSLGATHVIDYPNQDFTRNGETLTSSSIRLAPRRSLAARMRSGKEGACLSSWVGVRADRRGAQIRGHWTQEGQRRHHAERPVIGGLKASDYQLPTTSYRLAA